MNAQLVELYLDAENDISNKNYSEAFRKYESIIYEDPKNPMAHNSIGWLYKAQMDNFEMAEKHYKAAIRGNPDHPHAYYNYAVLLFEMERTKDLEDFLQRMLKNKNLDRAWVYRRYGLMSELQLNFEKAIAFYERQCCKVLIRIRSKSLRKTLKDAMTRLNWQKSMKAG